MSKRTYLGISTYLNKRWVVRARDIEDATGKVVSYSKNILTKLEKDHPDEDIDVDFKFMEMKEDVVEI